MLVQRDRFILKFIEDNGGITIYQCAKCFFNKSNHSYDLARKRLKKLYNMGIVKYITNRYTGERIYCTDKKISQHTVYLLDVYATLIQNGAEVLKFQKEPRWLGGKYRSDGFFLIEYNGTKRILCVEIDITHTTDVRKYEEIYLSNEIQSEYGVFPLIIIVGENVNEVKSDNFGLVYLDYKLNNFTEKVLAL